MRQTFTEHMKQGCAELNVMLTEHQLNQFYQYYELLVEWNKVMNLTAITEMEDVITKHFIDSISLIKLLKNIDKEEKSMIDVGTGAGFPGIPLKIAFPNLEIVLLDSLNKRLKFLDEVIIQLGLSNIRTVHGRAEDAGNNKEYREQFDYSVSRAVANIATLSEYCIPFVKVKGSFISYKSGKIDEELLAGKKAIHVLGGQLGQVERFQLIGTDADRALVEIKKVATTSKKFPRKAGTPSKEPIGNTVHN